MENKFDFPLFSWHFELASKCKLACPRCPRTAPENKHKFNVTEMELDWLKSTFTSDFINSEMESILLCGGHGDPIYHSKFLEVVDYFKSSKPKLRLRIITNGSYKNRTWWQSLARLLNEVDEIVFSIDGWDRDSNRIYRVNSDFDSIMIGLEEMKSGKATIHWSTILFKFNQEHISKIRDLAQQRGAHFFHLVFSTKFGAPWLVDGEDPLEPRPEFRSQYGRYDRYIVPLGEKSHVSPPRARQISERTEMIGSKYAQSQILPICQIGEWGFYVDASGIIYPCSWLSHPHDIKLAEGQKNPWLENRAAFSLKERSLLQVLNDESLWEPLFAQWKGKNPYSECVSKCGRKDNASRFTNVPTIESIL